MSRRPGWFHVSLVLSLVLGTYLHASQAPVPSPEATSLAQGWTSLAKGDASGALATANRVLAQQPNSAAALALAIEAELTLGGSSRALASYERWLGTRRMDEAYVLRRIAFRLLKEMLAAKDPAARSDALAALVADGDREAAAAAEQGAARGGFRELSTMAAAGNAKAFATLLAQLHSLPGSKTPVIEAIAATGNKAAIPQLLPLLNDPNDLNRAAAADALGRLGAMEAIPRLRTLLQDQFTSVKLKAAGALYRLNDSSGLPVLMDMTQSEHAAIRVAGAREMASNPDAQWQALVRSLSEDPDPAVRLDAARLIAPYDQPLAKRILDGLMGDQNMGIREAAAGVLVEKVAADMATLRRLLRSGDARVRAQAADRILELTR